MVTTTLASRRSDTGRPLRAMLRVLPRAALQVWAWVLCALLLVSLAQAQPQAARRLPDAKLFFADPMLGGARLSPDGRQVALRVRSGEAGKARLAVLALDTMKPTVVADLSDVDVGDFHWVNSGRLVFDTHPPLTGPNRIDAGPGLFAVNADGSGFRQLVETGLAWAKRPEDGVPLLPWRTRLLQTVSTRQGDDVWMIRPEEVSRTKVDYFNLQRLNTVTGRAEDVPAPTNAFGWTLDSAGELRLVTTRKDNRAAVQWRDPAGLWRRLVEFDPLQVPWTPRFIGPDGTLYVTAPHQGFDAAFTLDPATGQRSEQPLAAVKGFDLRPQFITGRNKLLGVRYTIDAEITQWLDPDAKVLQASIDAVLPATANRLSLPQRGDSPFVLVQAFADVQPMLSFVYNTATQKLTRLGSSHPGIDPAQMGQTDFVRYKAADGLEIPAYLTLPPGAAKKNLPLVVLVHGGPGVRGAQWQWDPEVQFLASRGYAVLQPEFRGGTGFGFRHFQAGWKQWGQAMQTDLADGARWAIAQGFADPKRIAIAGASYGGYAVLMGLWQNPELFRAGISWVGVTDPLMMFTVDWSDISEEGKKYSLATTLGDPVADAAMFKQISPLQNAARIRQPLLMAYGGWDVRVPIVHGEKFRDAIQPHNRQFEWVVYPAEGHGWTKVETRLDFWGRVERFLGRHLAAE